jgi:hypothetical protein
MKPQIATIQGFLDFLFKEYPYLNESEINLVYEGEITHQITKAFTSITEAKLGSLEEAASVQRKVFHVMVECLQNIDKHGDSFDKDTKTAARGLFIVSRCDNSYCVITGNIIDNRKVPGLKNTLETINNTDKETLKQMYKEQIKNGSLSDKGGAGLGFIDIARKTEEKYNYHFIYIDENVSFFIIKTTILRK